MKKSKGRPLKTTRHLPARWKHIIITQMSQGASRQEVKALLGISNDLWDRLLDEDVEFSETVKRGLALCEAWWLRQGRINLENRRFSPVLWLFNMKNRFGWRDRRDLDIATKGELGVVILPPEKEP